MKRETTNFIRFVCEDLLPPIVRDSRFFLWLARLAWGKHVDALADFRSRAPFLTKEEYISIYRNHPRIHDTTDNSRACVNEIHRNLIGDRICDVGCGTGYLLRFINENWTETVSPCLVGVDILPPQPVSPHNHMISAFVENLPFKDRYFDTVICTHVLEHILDFQTALQELRRITDQRMIIVVPKEREALYTFNPHFHFFPYTHSFLRHARPVNKYECWEIGRDIFYVEHIPSTGPAL